MNDNKQKETEEENQVRTIRDICYLVGLIMVVGGYFKAAVEHDGSHFTTSGVGLLIIFVGFGLGIWLGMRENTRRDEAKKDFKERF